MMRLFYILFTFSLYYLSVKSCPAWLDDYASFHEHQRSSNPEAAKYLVFSVEKTGFQGGLGDRIRAMLLVTRLAIASQRVVLFTWAHPFELEHFLIPSRIIDWRIKGTGLDLISPHPHYSWMVGQSWRPLDLIRQRPRDFVLQNGISSLKDRFIVISTNEHATTRCKGCPDIGNDSLGPAASCLFQYLFRFNSKIEGLASLALSSLGLGLGDHFIGLHLRLGGLICEPLLLEQENSNKVSRGGTLTRLLAGISCARKESGGKLPVLVVADNARVRAFIRGGHISGFLSSNLTPVHLDLAGPSVSLADHQSTFVEVLMLSRSQCLLMSPNSGFSLVALWQQGGQCWRMIEQPCD